MHVNIILVHFLLPGNHVVVTKAYTDDSAYKMMNVKDSNKTVDSEVKTEKFVLAQSNLSHRLEEDEEMITVEHKKFLNSCREIEILQGKDEITVQGESETIFQEKDETNVQGEGETTHIHGKGEKIVEEKDETAAVGEGETTAQRKSERIVQGESAVTVRGKGETTIQGKYETTVQGEGEANIRGEDEKTHIQGESAKTVQGEGKTTN